LFISFPEKKRTKESCPAICFSLRIYRSMGRNLFRLFPLNNKYSGASWSGIKRQPNLAAGTAPFDPPLAGCRDKYSKSEKSGGAVADF